MTEHFKIEAGPSVRTPDEVREELRVAEEVGRATILRDLRANIPGAIIAYLIPSAEASSLYPGLDVADGSGEASVKWLKGHLAALRDQYGTALGELPAEVSTDSSTPSSECGQIWKDTEQY